MWPSLRRLLFRLDAERAHALTLRLLALAGAIQPMRSGLRRTFSFEHPRLRTTAFGLDFANPVGLAAGYDKSGAAMHGLACLGFGHLELGSVTRKPQAGNPRPRVFRLESDRALINRMGFPNPGLEAMLARLKMRPSGVRIGVNIGKGSDIPVERAAEEYVTSYERLASLVDYVAVNVSSPNTPGLRGLERGEQLAELLSELERGRGRLRATGSLAPPLLIKLSPDLVPTELESALYTIARAEMDGVILTNTTVERSGLTSPRASEPGGLSGDPLFGRALETVRTAQRVMGDALPIVAVGGISSPERARRMLEAGAALVQLYTGLVYEGPGLTRRILEGLVNAKDPGEHPGP